MQDKAKVVTNEICCLSTVRKIAAMLDLDPMQYSAGDILPKSWHFFMLAGQTKKSDLRADGFPGLGVPMPDLGLPRLLLGGRTVNYSTDIVIGTEIERTSFVKNITEKTTSSGPIAIVTIQHELRPVLVTNPAITETQTYILLENKKALIETSPSKSERQATVQLIPNSEFKKQFIPDETLLFQYSALGFNSHKIHLDRDYARNVEGLPDLVVNGGLATILLTEFLRVDVGVEINDLKIKHITPLYCNRPLTLTADFNETKWKLRVYDENNIEAIEMEVQ